ncbi:hypothetical protein FGO68_gene7736 [Halteria grandinella]|uniref:Uncharacterized protein n=1 Tax=Halteria grandinella TaxID=5974 RepID=A0A8J8NRE7_HALGN|nr:hypothetical protein FGO68_gene7736 [Halteria grandinella]
MQIKHQQQVSDTLSFADKVASLFGWAKQDEDCAIESPQDTLETQLTQDRIGVVSGNFQDEESASVSPITHESQTRTSSQFEKQLNPKKRKLEEFKQSFISNASPNLSETENAYEEDSFQAKRFRTNPVDSSEQSEDSHEEESMEYILQGLMVSFFMVNKRYILRWRYGDNFNIIQMGQKKSVFKLVKYEDLLRPTFTCAKCSRTLKFESSELWILSGTPCNLCKGINASNIPGKIAQSGLKKPLAMKVESESMRIAKQAYGGALQRFVRENPNYRLQFSQHRMSYIKCQPLIINFKLGHKYVFNSSSRAQIAYLCHVRNCRARIVIHFNCKKDLTNCPFQIQHYNKHTEECKISQKKLAPVDHRLKLNSNKASEKALQIPSCAKVEEETSVKDACRSGTEENEVGVQRVPEDYVEELDKIIERLKVLANPR